MRELVTCVWKIFDELKKTNLNDYIVNTMPILYFGDYEAYQRSKIKIVTVSLNPSNREFSESRFHTSECLWGKSSLCEEDINIYLASLNEYFENNPYIRWFDDNRRLLFEVLNASYYNTTDTENRVLHIDIATPIATIPTWQRLGKVSNEIQDQFMNAQEGVWERLIQLLSPDIMLMSLSDTCIKKVDGDLYHELREFKYREEGNRNYSRYLLADYHCNEKTIKVLDIVTANRAFQFAINGRGHTSFVNILNQWKGELSCQK